MRRTLEPPQFWPEGSQSGAVCAAACRGSPEEGERSRGVELLEEEEEEERWQVKRKGGGASSTSSSFSLSIHHPPFITPPPPLSSPSIHLLPPSLLLLHPSITASSDRLPRPAATACVCVCVCVYGAINSWHLSILDTEACHCLQLLSSKRHSDAPGPPCPAADRLEPSRTLQTRLLAALCKRPHEAPDTTF